MSDDLPRRRTAAERAAYLEGYRAGAQCGIDQCRRNGAETASADLDAHLALAAEASSPAAAARAAVELRRRVEQVADSFEFRPVPQVGDDVVGPNGLPGKVTAVDGALVTMTFALPPDPERPQDAPRREPPHA